MLPIQILDLLGTQALDPRIHVDLLPLPIIIAHPQQQRDTQEQDGATSSEIQTVADRVIGAVEGEERPRGDQAADVTEHDIRPNGGGAGGVRDHIGGDMCVGQCAETECARGDDEGGAVSHLRVRGREEHYVADHHERGGGNEVDGAAVGAPAGEGDGDGEEGADDVGRDGLELLVDDCVAWVDCSHDGGREEGEALHGDVVEEED